MVQTIQTIEKSYISLIHLHFVSVDVTLCSALRFAPFVYL